MVGPGVFVARAPSLALWITLQAGMWSYVWSQYREPSLIKGPLPSHIPKAHIIRRHPKPFQAHDAYAA